MAISTLSKIAITLRTSLFNQVQMNVWTYNVLEIVGTPLAVNYAEAWWNHVKAAYRATVPASFGNTFRTIYVRELGNSTGEYAEWSVPTAEMPGTRATPADADADSPFAAAGVRLTVGTRITRPGQKRIMGLTQTDSANGTLGSAYTALLTTLMGTMTANMILGSPAAGVVLVPSVVGLNPDGTIRASQVVTGYVINPYVTTQNSRKFNRGM